ncbi:MAG: hypothetical protein FWD36_04310 [Treponema sp.]|nr:hypothetical protein [Treponema sp.]
MKNIQTYLKIAGLCLGALLIAACPSAFSPIASSGGNNIPAGMGVVNLSVAGSVERTIFPNMTGWEYTATFATSDDVSIIPDPLEFDGIDSQELEYATWTITITAKTADGDLVGSVTLPPVTLNASNNDVSFNNILITPISGVGVTEGFITWDVHFPWRVDSAMLYITNSDAANTSRNLTHDLTIPAVMPLSPASLPPGSWRFRVQVTAQEGSITRTAGKMEVVHVYPGLTSDIGTWTFNEESFYDSKDITAQVTILGAAAITAITMEADGVNPIAGELSLVGSNIYTFAPVTVPLNASALTNVVLHITTANTTLTTAPAASVAIADIQAVIPAVTLYPLQVSAGEDGSVTVAGTWLTANPSTVAAESNVTFLLTGGESVTVTAIPIQDYIVNTFTVSGGTLNLSGSDTYTFTMVADTVQVTAVFADVPTYTIEVTQPAEGTLAATPNTDLEGGEEITITLTGLDPDRYNFVSIAVEEKNGTNAIIPDGNYPEWTFEMPEYHVEISVVITPIPRAIGPIEITTAGIGGVGGTFVLGTLPSPILAGDVIPVTTTLNTDFIFGHIYVHYGTDGHALVTYDSVSGLPVSFVMPAADVTSIEVRFISTLIPRHAINGLGPVTGGTISTEGDITEQAEDEPVTVILTPAPGYRFSSALLDGAAPDGLAETAQPGVWAFTFTMGEDEVAVSAAFERIFAVQTVIVGGTLSADKAIIAVDEAVTVTLTITDPALDEFDNITITVGSQTIAASGTNPWTFSVSQAIVTIIDAEAGPTVTDVVVTVTLKDRLYDVSTASVLNGTITVTSGVTGGQAKPGDTVVITFTPSEFYRVATADPRLTLVAGQEPEAPGIAGRTRLYSFEMSTADVLDITGTFAAVTVESFDITFEGAPAETEFTMVKGTTGTLAVLNIAPIDALNQTVTYISWMPESVTVNADGLLTAVTAGSTAGITVMVGAAPVVGLLVTVTLPPPLDVDLTWNILTNAAFDLTGVDINNSSANRLVITEGAALTITLAENADYTGNPSWYLGSDFSYGNTSADPFTFELDTTGRRSGPDTVTVVVTIGTTLYSRVIYFRIADGN